MLKHIWRRFGAVIDGRRTFGADGERLARRMLRRRGYRILDTNARLGRDEADIIALAPDGHTRVIVEVKTRRADEISPELAVNREKRRCLERFAHTWRNADPRHADAPIRFDVVAIVHRDHRRPEVRHHIGAFDAQR